MEEISSSIDPRRLKSFVRHICIIARKHKDKQQARKGLYSHIRKIKRLSSQGENLDTEIQELNQKISLVLEKEAELLGIKRNEDSHSHELMDNIFRNKSKIQSVQDSLNEIKGQLHSYIQSKTERERKIANLEKKIQNKANVKKQAPMLRKKLRDLEKLCSNLKKKGLDVNKIKTRISNLKARLA